MTVPAELLASLIQTAEQALWKREWAARDYGLAVPECVTRRQAVVNQARILLKTTHTKTADVIAACGRRYRRTINHERKHNAERTDLSSRL